MRLSAGRNPLNIPKYPEFTGITLEAREEVHPYLKSLEPQVSEFSFANLFLFRGAHNYRLSILKDNSPVIAGNDRGRTFFMLPGGLPSQDILKDLFENFSFMKCATEDEVKKLISLGYEVVEDRDNFDYLYSRSDLSSLAGRRFHRKKNLVNFFTGSYNYEARPLLDEYMEGARSVLEAWRSAQQEPGDYEAAKEALHLTEELVLCGAIYFVEGKPAAYTLGEELNKTTFAVHFEKGVPGFKGLMQFVNKSFASILPEKYLYINREQDLGDEGLRKSKTSYRPVGFVKKYRAAPKGVWRP